MQWKRYFDIVYKYVNNSQSISHLTPFFLSLYFIFSAQQVWNELYDLIHKSNCSLNEKQIKYSNEVPKFIGFVDASLLLVDKKKKRIRWTTWNETLWKWFISCSFVVRCHSSIEFFYHFICMSSFRFQRRYTVIIVLHYIIHDISYCFHSSSD